MNRALPFATAFLALVTVAACGSETSTEPAVVNSTVGQQPGLPTPWFGGTSRTDLYQIGTDVAVRRGGNASVYLRSLTNTVYAPTSPGSYFDRTLLPFDYDGLIWFANTTASILLPF